MKELILVTGVGKDANEETIRNAIPEEQRQHVSKVSDYTDTGLGLFTRWELRCNGRKSEVAVFLLRGLQ